MGPEFNGTLLPWLILRAHRRSNPPEKRGHSSFAPDIATLPRRQIGSAGGFKWGTKDWLRTLPGIELAQNRAPDELAQDRVVGNQVCVDRLEPFQEGQQAFRLYVFRRSMRHLPDERLGQRRQGRAFVKQGRVEHHVGVFLERKDVALLTPAHRFPAPDRLAGCIPALGCVAHDAANETCVRR